jgi:hypothetical protein
MAHEKIIPIVLAWVDHKLAFWPPLPELQQALRCRDETPITKVEGVTIMQVNSTSSASGATGSATSTSQLAALQKQLRTLTQKLKDLAANTSLDAKTKRQESQLLQMQIALVQAQIAAIQNQQQLTQLNKAHAASRNQTGQSQNNPKPAGVVAPDQVDAYA